MEHLDFENTEMEHLNFLDFWEETRTAEQACGWKLVIMYTFIKRQVFSRFWQQQICINTGGPPVVRISL